MDSKKKVSGRINDLLNRATNLTITWRSDVGDEFEQIEQEVISLSPERVEEFKAIRNKRDKVQNLLKKAFNVGAGSQQYKWDTLLQEAGELKIKELEQKLHDQYQSGLNQKKKSQNTKNKFRSHQKYSNVTPRGKSKRAVSYPTQGKSKRMEKELPVPEMDLHPNDIRSLEPTSEWLLLIDETGSNFGLSKSGKQGKFVGLLINKNNPCLKGLQRWHASEVSDHSEIDTVFQRVLDAPCGVIGMTVLALPNSPHEQWLAGVQAIIDWVLRLFPLGTFDPVRLEVFVEGRPPYVPGAKLPEVRDTSMTYLSRVFPERASKIQLSVKTISKDQHPFNAYVDAIAYTWGSSCPESKERLKRSGMRETCLLNISAQQLTACWDAMGSSGAISAQQWSSLVGSKESKEPASVVSGILQSLKDECQANRKLWDQYFEEARLHLQSKALHLPLLKSQVDWLEKTCPEEVDLPPLLRLVWLTSQLALANHLGEAEHSWIKELKALGDELYLEDARLVCYMDLHLAVNATNRFDFETASSILERWEPTDTAITGLRYRGQILSSLGQHAAFKGDNRVATTYFEKALDAFAKLSFSDDRKKESSQTKCYLAISMMDDDSFGDEEVKSILKEYFAELTLGELTQATQKLAISDQEKDKYAHHLMLRWLTHRGDTNIQEGYLSLENDWETGEGHPWPLIELYRGLLLRPDRPEEGLERVVNASILAFSSYQGPTVNLIGACCRAIANAWGEECQGQEETLDKLEQQIPQAKQRIDILKNFDGKECEPLELLKKVLPFNFR